MTGSYDTMIDLTYLTRLVGSLSGSKISGRFGEWGYMGVYGTSVFFVLNPTDPDDNDDEFDPGDWDLPMLTFSLKGSGVKYEFLPDGQGTRAEAEGFIGAKWSGSAEDDQVVFFEVADAVLQEIEDEDKYDVFNNPELAGGKTNFQYKTKVTKTKPADLVSAPSGGSSAKGAPSPKDWRTSDDDTEVARLFQQQFRQSKPTADDIMDLFNKAKQLRSNRLITFARTLRTESLKARRLNARQLVDKLLESETPTPEIQSFVQLGWRTTSNGALHQKLELNDGATATVILHVSANQVDPTGCASLEYETRRGPSSCQVQLDDLPSVVRSDGESLEDFAARASDEVLAAARQVTIDLPDDAAGPDDLHSKDGPLDRF